MFVTFRKIVWICMKVAINGNANWLKIWFGKIPVKANHLSNFMKNSIFVHILISKDNWRTHCEDHEQLKKTYPWNFSMYRSAAFFSIGTLNIQTKSPILEVFHVYEVSHFISTRIFLGSFMYFLIMFIWTDHFYISTQLIVYVWWFCEHAAMKIMWSRLVLE